MVGSHPTEVTHGRTLSGCMQDRWNVYNMHAFSADVCGTFNCLLFAFANTIATCLPFLFTHCVLLFQPIMHNVPRSDVTTMTNTIAKSPTLKVRTF